MKKLLFISILLIIISTVFAQYPRASLWTADMANFASQDATNGIPSNEVLFVGSSSFTKWTTLASDFPNSYVLNRGFGGSWMTDAIYFFDQLVKPYTPCQVVLYEGDNDLLEGTKTAESFMDDEIAMIRLINIYYPNAKIILIAIKPSPSRQAYFTKYQAANALMKSYAQNHSDLVTFVDIWEAMLNGDGTPNTSLYVSDMLHMNSTGYAIWINALKPLLITSNEPIPVSDKIVFTESSNPLYHDMTWSNVTAPSTFTTVQAEKISTDSTHFHNGHTSLKYEYQGITDGNWQACVAAAAWTPMDITKCDTLEFYVTADATVQTVDLPYIFLEAAVTGAKTNKLVLSNYISSVTVGVWTVVKIPVADFQSVSPDFAYNNVKTVFMSQLNTNIAPVKFFVDDMVFKANTVTPPPPTGSGSVLIDFGAGNTTVTGWNNVTGTQSGVTNLKDDSGTLTNMSLTLTSPFDPGYNTNGTTSPSGAAAVIPATATADNFFGHNANFNGTSYPNGTFTLSGLDVSKNYSFAFFASRTAVTDNRTAEYDVTGDGNVFSVLLDAANNTSNIAEIKDVKPNASGVITVVCKKGAGNTNSSDFYYLGAMKLTISDNTSAFNTPSLTNFNPYYTNGILKIGDFTGEVKVYSLTGSLIKEGLSVFGQLAVRLDKGTYIVKTNADINKVLVH